MKTYTKLLEDKDKIINAYINDKMNAGEIAEKFYEKRYLYSIITRILKENNIKIRNQYDLRGKHLLNINENYFKIIDSHEKAYWLGFLYADGSIIYRNNLPSKIVLALKDKEPIEAFKKAINSDHKICDYHFF